MKKIIILIILCSASFNTIAESKEEKCKVSATAYLRGLVDPEGATKMINTINGYGESVSYLSGVPKELILLNLTAGMQLNAAGTTKKEAEQMAQQMLNTCMTE